jgi:ribokinase
VESAATRGNPRVAVVGHVEWVEFLRVPHVPVAGDIVHATDVFAQAAGGGGVASVQLRKLAGSCTFFTALADDEIGHAAATDLEARGVELRVAWRTGERQRRAITFVDDRGERTITVLGDRLGPSATDQLGWDDLAGFDAIYLTAADADGVRAARAAKALVATSRVLALLREARVELDAVVGSSRDPSEAYAAGDLDPAPRYAVMTAGASGGTIQRTDGGPETFAAAELPGLPVDAYGAGDSFAAGLTYGLGADMSIDDAVALAARCGAHNMTGRGAYDGQLVL